MNILIEILNKKLELLKKRKNLEEFKEEILKLDIKFSRYYDIFLEKNKIKNLDEIDKNLYKSKLIELKKLVSEILKIENDNKNNIQETKKFNKRQINLYKKNMK